MGVSADQWLSTLGAAGLAAFHCRRDADGIVIVSRTPEFVGTMQTLSGTLDERTLLSQLTARWPTVPGSEPFEVAADASTWRCVLQPTDGADDDYLAILRLSDTLRPPNNAFSTIVENLPDIVTRYTREYRCLYANPALGAATGVPAEARFGRTLAEMVAPAELAAEFEAWYSRVVDTGAPVELEFAYTGPAGLCHYLGRATPEFDHSGEVSAIMAVIRDVSEVRRLQHQLEHLARTDPLTSLLNRRSFTDRLDVELARVRTGQAGFSLLMLDLDHFKDINDRFGHVAGDRVLEAVGRILLAETRPHDVVARLGGDEFCIALIDTCAEDARAAADRIRRQISGIEGQDGTPIGVSVSIGVAVADDDVTALDLLSQVDALMYQSKLGGRRG
ncbi:GGDEF domain-containing protein [Mycolicibacterium sp. ELW1]|nr:GGDEF domain-containing protein [Mycobacterium sp. ELW1]QEN15668.1 GGDEF domain-containing protein [Mycobacterium sp. ELW1]